ncbi:MAG: dihydropteroate synthase [Gemmatimonadota bacterium]
MSRTGAEGLEPLAFAVDEIGDESLQALVRAAPRAGLEVATGEGKAVIAGVRARLAAFVARPWQLPAPLVELAHALGGALPGEDPASWRTAAGGVDVTRAVLVGILNVTPDSFSDGGRYPDVEAVRARAGELVASGATILDVGGESTRPGRPVPVSADEEHARTIPVIEALRRDFPAVLISIDTVKSSVARAALDAGAAIVNDVSGGRADPDLLSLAAEKGAGLVLMHSRGAVTDMASYDYTDYPRGLTATVVAELGVAIDRAIAAGVSADQIVVDPGLGFGKKADQSLELCRHLGALRTFGRPILVGPSRKRFIGQVLDRPVEERDVGTAAVCAHAWQSGARLFRIHEPAVTRDVLAMIAALEGQL